MLCGVTRRLINDGIVIDAWVGPDDRNSQKYILQVEKQDEDILCRRVLRDFFGDDVMWEELNNREVTAWKTYTYVPISIYVQLPTLSNSQLFALQFSAPLLPRLLPFH